MSGQKILEADRNKIDPKFICTLCAMLLRSPMQTSCGHLLCHDCLQTLLKYVSNLASELYIYIYISGVRSSGHRVKPNIAVDGALSYVSLGSGSFRFTCHVKTGLTCCPVGDPKIPLV